MARKIRKRTLSRILIGFVTEDRNEGCLLAPNWTRSPEGSRERMQPPPDQPELSAAGSSKVLGAGEEIQYLHLSLRLHREHLLHSGSFKPGRTSTRQQTLQALLDGSVLSRFCVYIHPGSPLVCKRRFSPRGSADEGHTRRITHSGFKV